MSPISSSSSVPPSASSKRPLRSASAPVKAPRSWPKSSLSSTPSGSAAQLTLMKGFSRRGENSWISCAKSSLPEPLSPRSSTLRLVGATRRAWASADFNTALSPTIFRASGFSGAFPLFASGAGQREAKRDGPIRLATRPSRRKFSSSLRAYLLWRGLWTVSRPMILPSNQTGAARNEVFFRPRRIAAGVPAPRRFFRTGVAVSGGWPAPGPATGVRRPSGSSRATRPSRRSSSASRRLRALARLETGVSGAVRIRTISSSASRTGWGRRFSGRSGRAATLSDGCVKGLSLFRRQTWKGLRDLN